MKKFVLTVIALCIMGVSFAQDQNSEFTGSKLQLNVGLGFSYYHNFELPAYLGADYWITPEVTLGAEAIFRLGFFYAGFGGIVNANYHLGKLLDLPDNLDLYAGVSAGPYFYPYETDRFDVDFHIQLGGRYRINDNIWLHGEVGGGSFSGGKIGITFRR